MIGFKWTSGLYEQLHSTGQTPRWKEKEKNGLIASISQLRKQHGWPRAPAPPRWTVPSDCEIKQTSLLFFFFQDILHSNGKGNRYTVYPKVFPDDTPQHPGNLAESSGHRVSVTDLSSTQAPSFFMRRNSPS